MASDSKTNIDRASALTSRYGDVLKHYICACEAESAALKTNHIGRLGRANIFSLAGANGNTFTDRPFRVFDERRGGANRQAQPRVTFSIADFRVTSITTRTLPADSAPGAACSSPPTLLPEGRSARVCPGPASRPTLGLPGPRVQHQGWSFSASSKNSAAGGRKHPGWIIGSSAL